MSSVGAFPLWETEVMQWFLRGGKGSWQEFFANELRGELFSGALTFSAFLFAAYTFVVIHMKTEVYDSPEYREVFQEKRKADSRLKLYDPLRGLSRQLILSVVLTMVAGVFQLTVGLWPTNLSAVICVLVFIGAIAHLGYCVRLMTENMGAWFDALDASANEAVPPAT